MDGRVTTASARAGAIVVTLVALFWATGCGDNSDAGKASGDEATAAQAGAAAQVSAGTSAQAGAGEPAGNERGQDFPAMTTAAAIRTAQRIALVSSRGSRYVEGAPGTPFTRTDFTVERVLKGSLPKSIAVQVIGGELGNTSVESPVRPFVKGRRYILFLGPQGKVGPTIIPQAVLEVRRSGSVDVVDPEPDGIRLLTAGSSKPARTTSAGPILADVLFSIRRYVRIHRTSP